MCFTRVTGDSLNYLSSEWEEIRWKIPWEVKLKVKTFFLAVKLKVKACGQTAKGPNEKPRWLYFFPTFLWREVWWQALKRGCQFDLFDLMCKTLSPKVPCFAVVLCGVRTASTRNSQAAYGILLVVCFSLERISPTSPDVVWIINVDDLIYFRAVFHIRNKFNLSRSATNIWHGSWQICHGRFWHGPKMIKSSKATLIVCIHRGLDWNAWLALGMSGRFSVDYGILYIVAG